MGGGLLEGSGRVLLRVGPRQRRLHTDRRPDFLYLLVIWPLLRPELSSVALWVLYGLARSSNLWWLALDAPLGSPAPYALNFNERLQAKARWMRVVNALVLVAAGAWLLGSVA